MRRGLFALRPFPFFACLRALASGAQLRYNIFQKISAFADENKGLVRQVYGTGSEEASGQVGADA